jgi:hypothetical protein
VLKNEKRIYLLQQFSKHTSRNNEVGIVERYALEDWEILKLSILEKFQINLEILS